MESFTFCAMRSVLLSLQFFFLLSIEISCFSYCYLYSNLFHIILELFFFLKLRPAEVIDENNEHVTANYRVSKK